MNNFNLLVVLVAIGLSILYLRKYVSAKAENLAQKEDLRDLTNIVERVRTQFQRANVVHKAQFEAEFGACQDLWHKAHDTFREFIVLFPMSGQDPQGQRAKFGNAQLAFSNRLEECKPFVSDVVWQAFYDFEGLILVWKDVEMPLNSRKEIRHGVTVSLERCVTEIRRRFSELLVVRN